MPTDAFIQAAKKADRKPVALLAIESVDAIKVGSDTYTDWQASKSASNLNIEYERNTVFLTTDGDEPYRGTYAAPQISMGGAYMNTGYTDVTVSTPATNEHATVFTVSGRVRNRVVDPPPYEWFNRQFTMWLQVSSDNGVTWDDIGSYVVPKHPDNLWLIYTITGTAPRGSYIARIKTTYVNLREIDSEYEYNFIEVWFDTYDYQYTTIYATAGSLRTKTLTLGETPEIDSHLEIDDTVPSGCSLSYTARGSDNGTDWVELGPVADGDALAPYRDYDFDVTFGSNTIETPRLMAIRVVGGNSQFDYYSTHKDYPVQGAKPYIVPDSISSLTSKVDLLDSSTVGELSCRLFWRKKTSDMIAAGYLKNKTVISKVGYLGLAEEDFEPYFTGVFQDWSADTQKKEFTIKTWDVLKKFNRKIPAESYFFDETGTRVSSLTYHLTGTNQDGTVAYSNIMQVMLDIADLLGIPDRLINRSSFTELRDGVRSGAVWKVKRELYEQADAMELLNELRISAGVFLIPMPDGRLTAILYDDALSGETAGHIDAVHHVFEPIEGGQKNLATQAVIWHQLISGKSGNSQEDYGKVFVKVFSRDIGEPEPVAVMDIWGEGSPVTKEWLDKWGMSPTALAQLADRFDAWFGEPRATVKVKGLPPRLSGMVPGRIVEVDNLQLPCPVANWEGYTTGKKFLILSKTPEPLKGTFSLELYEVGPTTYVAEPNFPSYQVFDFFPAVQNLQARECVVQRAAGPVDHIIVLTFDQPTDFRYGGAEIYVSTNSGPFTPLSPVPFTVPGAKHWIEIPVVVGSAYDIRVITVNAAGLKQNIDSAPAVTKTTKGISEVTYAPPVQTPPTGTTTPPVQDRDLPGVVVVPTVTMPPVSGLQLFGQGNNTVLTGRDAKITWNRYSARYQTGAASGPAGGTVDLNVFYTVIVRNTDETVRRRISPLTVNEYVYDYERNYNDGTGTPARQFIVDVIADDGRGNVSEPSRIIVSNPAPAKIPSITLTGGLNAFSVSFDPLNEPDVTTGGGYLIHLSTTPGFTPTANTLLNKGPETSKYVDRLPGSDNEGLPGGTYYIRVAAHDTFGTDALNYSDEYSVTVSDMGVLDTVPPDVPTTLSAASGIEQLTQTQTAYVNLSWSAPTPADLAAGDFNPASQKGGYTVRYKPAADTFWTEQPANTNAAKITGLIPNSSYQFQVMAFDQWGNATAWSSVLTATSAKKTTAPSGISDASLKVYGGIKSIWVEWTPVTDRDVAYYEILVGENGAPEIYRAYFENQTGYGDTDPTVSLYYPLSAWAAGASFSKDPILQPSLWGVYKTFASITDPEYLGYPVYAMNTSYVNTRPFRTLSNKFVFDILGTTYVTHHVKVRVVDTSGNASAWSSVKTSDPSKVVYSDIYVGNLAAISADLGTITAGTINATANVNAGSLTTGTMKAATAILVGGATNGVEISGAGKITVREGGADRIILGLQSTGYYGLTVRNAAGQDVFKQFKDAGGTDQTIIQNLTAATLAADWITSGGMNISWSGGHIRSGKATATDTTAGFWIGNNGGTPYLHVGNATKYMQWNGTALTVRGEFNADDITSGTLTGRTIQTAASGERFVVSVTDKQARFYDSGGNIKAIIGTGTSGGGSLAYGVFGDSTDTAATRHGVVGEAYDAFGVYGYATRFGVGVRGTSISGEGVFGQSVNSFGVKGYGKAAGVYGATQQDTSAPGYGVLCQGADFNSGGVWYLDKAPLRLIPSASATAPTHSADVGALWVTSAGVLYINKGSTTWEKVGAQ